MQSELKPCPFCGGDAEYYNDKGPTGEVYGWVGCSQCDAMSVHCDIRSMQPEETHPIAAWNTRASDAELARLTEALRAAEEREKALRVKWAELHNTCNVVGSPYDEALQAVDRLVTHIRTIARAALAGAKP